MVDLSHAYRMSCKTFEKTFFPAFKEFSFLKAKKIATDLLGRQDHQEMAIKIAQIFQNKKVADRKFVCSFSEFYATHALALCIEQVKFDMIDISKNPEKYRTPCCDAAFDAWLNQGKMYVATHGRFVNELKKLAGVDHFSVNGEFDLNDRLPTWKRVFDESCRMHVDIIKGSAKIGLDDVCNNLVKKEMAA
jgi:hypothetical protein